MVFEAKAVNEDQQREFLEAVRTVLDRSIESLDAATASRLTEARYRALEGSGGERSGRSYWVPGLAFASLVAGVLVVVLRLAAPDIGTTATLEDIELLSSNDSMELYEELEFLEWLDARG